MTLKYNKNVRHLILDSNIIQYLMNPLLAEGILTCLKEAMGANYPLAISDFTFFELLNGVTPKKEAQMITELNYLVRIHVRKEILVGSAHLGCMYQDDKMDLKQIDTGDLIIAASSIITNSLIFTANIRDFPVPFFNIIAKRPINYSKKTSIPALLMTAFLEPDLEFIGKTHKNRIGSVN